MRSRHASRYCLDYGCLPNDSLSNYFEINENNVTTIKHLMCVKYV